MQRGNEKNIVRVGECFNDGEGKKKLHKLQSIFIEMYTCADENG